MGSEVSQWGEAGGGEGATWPAGSQARPRPTRAGRRSTLPAGRSPRCRRKARPWPHRRQRQGWAEKLDARMQPGCLRCPGRAHEGGEARAKSPRPGGGGSSAARPGGWGDQLSPGLGGSRCCLGPRPAVAKRHRCWEERGRGRPLPHMALTRPRLALWRAGPAAVASGTTGPASLLRTAPRSGTERAARSPGSQPRGRPRLNSCSEPECLHLSDGHTRPRASSPQQRWGWRPRGAVTHGPPESGRVTAVGGAGRGLGPDSGPPKPTRPLAPAGETMAPRHSPRAVRNSGVLR